MQKRIAVRFALAVPVSLALCLAAGCSRDPNVRKQKYLESGKRYEDAAKYKEAAIQFSNALKVDKNFSDAHYELGKTYLKMGSVMPGYSELMKTVDLAPSNLQARIDLGNLLLAGHSTDRAEVQAKAVLAANPNSADAYALLGAVAEKRGDKATAMLDIEHALQLDPNRSSFHTALGVLQADDPGHEGSAEEELRRAATLDSKNAYPHMVLASLLEKKGDRAGAEHEYQAAIAATPKNIQPRAALTGLYMRAGDKAKAEDTLHQAALDMPESEEAAGLLQDFYVKTGQMDRAATVFAELNSKYPKSFAIKLTYARVLVEKKDFAKATTVVNELAKSDANNSQVQTLNAILLLNTGKINDAFTLLQKATKDNPNIAQTQLLLAQVAMAKGDAATAETSFRAAAKLSPANMEAQTGLAEVAIHRNDASMLLDVAEKTIKEHPDLAQGYLWRGSAEANQKEYDKANADFNEVIKKDPNGAAGYVELGEVSFIQGHAPEGKALMEKALEKDPNSIRALSTLADLDLRAKQPAKAIALVQAQIAKSPNNGEFYEALAFLQLHANDFKGAAENAHKAMQLAPANFDAVKTYGQAEIAQGNGDAAIAAWQQWSGMHPGDARALSMLGTLEETKGETAKATDYYKKALQADPNDPIAANNLAYLMIEGGQNVDVALALAQTARRGAPDSPDTADTLAWVYYYKGNYSSGRDLLEDALKLHPDNASMQFHLGMTYSKLNDKADAVLHLKKAVAIAPNSKAGQTAAAELAKLS